MAVIAQNKWLLAGLSATLIGSATMWEGVKYVPYLDVGGVPTVCMGYTGKGIVMGKTYTHEECTRFLRTELKVHSVGVLNCITKPLKQHEHDAFTLMAYNVGVRGFCSSGTAKAFNEGNTEKACNLISFKPSGAPNWSYVAGRFVRGLFNRRLFERDMCLGVKV